MDALNRARRPLRKELKQLCDDIANLLKEPVVDKDAVRVHYRLMMEAFQNLSEIDQKVIDQLVIDEASEEQQDDEYSKIREMKIRVETLRIKLDNVLAVSAVQSEASDNGTSSLDGDAMGLRLPKYQFKKFSGKLMDWLGFWAQFQKVDQHPKLTGSDKFSYLLMSLQEGTEAYDLVNAFPQSNENYSEAVDALKRRYGNEDLLLQVYIRELLKLVISNVNSKEKLPFPTLYTKVDSHLRALKTLNLASADPATWLYPLVESCLPDDILLTWQRNPMTALDVSFDGQSKTRLDLLMEFLGKEVDIRQRMGIAREGFENAHVESSSKQNKRKSEEPGENKSSFGKKQRRNDFVPTLTGFQNIESRLETCLFCQKKGHRTADCISAKKLSFEERKKIAIGNKLCFNCLGKHYARTCRNNLRCLICSGKHCNAMCKKLGLLPTASTHEPATVKESHSQAIPAQVRDNQIVNYRGNATQSFSNQVSEGHIVLQTLQVVIQNGSRNKTARVFLDSGSQRSYILKSTAKSLGLKEKGSEIVAHELFGGNLTERVTHKKYDVKLMALHGGYQCQIEVRDQDKISNSVPSITMSNKALLSDLQQMGIVLSDVGDGRAEIEVLIGADNYGLLLTGNIVNIGHGQVAVETKLGWTLIGGQGSSELQESVMTMSATDYSISQLWDLDTIGVRDNTDVKSEAQEELEAKERFLQDITRDKSGRYIVKLPWKQDHPFLPDNKAVAIKRLLRTTKKLKDAGLYEVYGKLFMDWEEEGFIEEVGESSDSKNVHYIPHRAVIKTSSLTTPVRPVFDASCKVGKAPSLNDCLHKGTNYIQLLPDILYRFRGKKIGFSSDIRKAFQMIEVDPGDRDAMRFLWWKSDTELKIYRHRRVMFGATCSPFILGAVLDFHLTHLSQHQDIGQKLLKSMYVDNSITSEDTIKEYKRFREISTKLLSDCQMDLRLWLSNVDEFQDPATHVVSVLGLQWDRINDQLFVKVDDISVPEKVTKRTVLSTAHKVFDPIGITCPAMVPMKTLLQRSFINKLKWDQDLPSEESQLFLKMIEELPLLGKIRIPRPLMMCKSEGMRLSLHTFTDSSSIAYSCVTYLRLADNQNVTVKLLSAKSRVAPVKRMTIPRLELLGCLIGARQCNAIKSSLSLQGIPETYWSDSSTALAWIKRNDAWGTFVGNRTKEINQLTNKDDWRHVPGSINPADLPSRGCTASFLLNSEWWTGPSWLYETEDLPDASEEENEDEILKERLKKAVIAKSYISMTVLNEDRKERSFACMVRIVGWILRFANNCKSVTKQSGALTFEELSAAESSLVYGIQLEAFADCDMKRFQGLDVMRDERGLLCVKTRTVRRDDLVESSKPVVLPGDHPMVKQLIWDYHRNYCHAGVGFLLTKLRQKYWILKARKSVKHVISKCFRCRRLLAKPAITETSPLPMDRIKDAEVYEVVGVDLAGPLILRNGKKVWLVIITCAIYRAVYLDIVDNLSTRAFIKCLEKFIEKHRRPDIIYSDNGTNFRGSDNFFRSLDWKTIQEEEQIRPITWKFNPPGGPWWGGWWERLIRTVKDLLKRSVGKASLSKKELAETLKIIQDVMNTRPLTYVTENPDDLEPLTPAMFLKPSGVFKFPEGQLSDGERLRIRYNYMKKLWEELKQRFKREYLSLIVSKSRKKPTRPLKEGELVVVGSEQRKRLDWPLGRIIKLIPGHDGVVRVAKVRMADGELTRPVQRLHPLELDGETNVAHHMKTRSKSSF